MHNQHTNKDKKISEGSQSELHSPLSMFSYGDVFMQWYKCGNFWKSVPVCCTDANHAIYRATSDHPACSSRSPFPPWCHRAMLFLLMPTRSFCSETHQSARCLIGSERWESIAICTPAPKSSLWTCHSRRITCSCLVLHLTKGSPISTGRKKKIIPTYNVPILSHTVGLYRSSNAARSIFAICVQYIIICTDRGRTFSKLRKTYTQWPLY